jgi:hypothetical protein
MVEQVEAFEDLDVFRRAYRLSLDVHRKSLEFPPLEQRALADQLRRASKSICANIAEGFSRQGRSAAEFKRFWAWRWDRPTRCGSGCVIAWTWAMSMPRPGAVGATSIRRSRRCCRGCRASGGPAADEGLLTSDFCLLTSGSVAERSVGL